MNIFLDTNIFFQDKWLRGHRFRRLLAYVARSKSKIVVLEPVELELRALMKQHFASVVAKLEDARHAAWEAGISVVIPDCNGLAEVCLEHWHREWWRTLSYNGAVRRPITSAEVAKEMVRRAAERIAPASASGKETRDVVVWLSFLDMLKAAPTEDACFVSQNTADFASSDKASFREELKPDVAGHLAAVRYYDRLDGFLRDHADRIAHITHDWVDSHVDWSELEKLVLAQVQHHTDPSLFVVDDEVENGAFYSPASIAGQLDTTALFNDVSAWPSNDGVIEIALDVSILVESTAECVLNLSKAPPHAQLPTTRALPVYSVGYADVVGVCRNDVFSFTGVENVFLHKP